MDNKQGNVFHSDFHVGLFILNFGIINSIYYTTFIISEVILNGMDMNEVFNPTVVASIIGSITTMASIFVTALITGRHERNSQLVKNTEAINELKRQLGVDDNESLTNRLSRQYSDIRSDIGLESNKVGSLTYQHESITKELNRDFEDIKARYEKEDAEYRKFTSEQHDINRTMQNFLTDYRKVVGDVHEYRNEIFVLRKQLEEKDKLLQEKDKTIAELNNTVSQKENASDTDPATDID